MYNSYSRENEQAITARGGRVSQPNTIRQTPRQRSTFDNVMQVGNVALASAIGFTVLGNMISTTVGTAAGVAGAVFGLVTATRWVRSYR
jgi:hypothetical protein